MKTRFTTIDIKAAVFELREKYETSPDSFINRFLKLVYCTLTQWSIIIIIIIDNYGRRRMPLSPHLLQLVINT